MKRIKSLLRALGGALLALSAVGAPASAAEPIKIGVIGTYSGPFADYGRQFDNGINLFLSQHDGKIAGRLVTIVRKDTSGAAPAAARRFAQELIVRDKVDFIVGLDFSPNALAVAPVVTAAKTPTVIMNAAASGIPAKSPYMVRVAFTVAQVSAPMAEWALEHGIKEAMIIVSDYGPGLDAEAAFSRVFTAGGGAIKGTLRVPLSNPDFAAYVLRIRTEKPESVFFFFPSGEMPTAFMKAARDAGLDKSVKFIATGEATDDTFLPATGDQLVGLITAHHYSYAADSAANRRFVKAYVNAYGSSLRPGYFAVAAYDGMAAIARALEGAGGDLDPDKIMQQLYGMRLDSPRGPIQISADAGDIIQNVYIRKTELVNGEPVNVEFVTYEAVADPGGAD